MARVDALKQFFGDTLEPQVASYSSNASIYEAIDRLNSALIASGKNFLVSPSNFYTFIGTIAPLVTIDGRIAFTRRVPEWDQLRAAVEEALVPMQVASRSTDA
jgi:hypothetical protein